MLRWRMGSQTDSYSGLEAVTLVVLPDVSLTSGKGNMENPKAATHAKRAIFESQ